MLGTRAKAVVGPPPTSAAPKIILAMGIQTANAIYKFLTHTKKTFTINLTAKSDAVVHYFPLPQSSTEERVVAKWPMGSLGRTNRYVIR